VAQIPENARKAWDERQGPCVFTTVGADGVPNSVWVTCVKMVGDDTIVVADNKFHKTRKNIEESPKVSMLYIAPEKKAFQVKGTVSYETEGSVYEDMKKGWLDPKFPGRGAVVIHVEEVYSGADKIA
jgi:uncharacterized protein